MERHSSILGSAGLVLLLGIATVGVGCSSMNEQTQNSEQPAQDTWITTKIRTAFATMEGVENSDMGVETSNGIVTLSGRVESQSQLDDLVAAAKRVKGVKTVHTDLVNIVSD